MNGDIKKYVALFTGTSDVFTNPTLVSFFELMQQKGRGIVLFSYEQIVSPPSHLNNIIYCFLPPMKINQGGVMNRLISFKIYFDTFKILKKYKITHLIGVDYFGFIIASHFKKNISNSKLGYFSFELLFLDEIKEQKYLDLKKKEKYRLKKLDYLIIQDEVRLSLFLKENHLELNTHIKIFKIPVAPKKINIDKLSGWDLHKKMNIPENKKVVIYSGSIGEWAGTDQLINMLENYWNKNFWLVLHSRLPLREDDEYLLRINKLIAEGFPVSLHAEPFDSYIDYAAFLKNFDVAVVLYKSRKGSMYSGKNLEEIGLASGKFSMYLMMGIPVITSPQTIYKQLLEKFKFGAVIEDETCFSELLSYCFVNKEELNKNALALYDSILDPEQQLSLLIEQLEL
jgi:glycosyltransferase involved in cell wall biosynthesis